MSDGTKAKRDFDAARGFDRDRRSVATMPFAALLPKIGDVSATMGFAEMLERRAAELQDTRDELTDLPEEELRLRQSEEAMLIQVLQWLAVDQGRGQGGGEEE